MSVMKIEFPVPVLALERDDYKEECVFDISFNQEDIVVSDEFLEVKTVCEFSCRGLQTLVDSGKADVIILVSSSAGSFRQAFVIENYTEEYLLKIPKFHVKSTVKIRGYIVSKVSDEIFSCDEFNDLYFKNVNARIKKGDILAIGEERSFPLDDSELEKPISSIFSIARARDESKSIEVYFDDVEESEKIVIALNTEMSRLYYDMKDFNHGSFRGYLTGIIFYPALVEAIAKVCEHYQTEDGVGGADYSDKRWFRAIVRQAVKRGYNMEDYTESYTELANVLLGDTAKNALISVKSTIEDEMDNGEISNLGGRD